MLEVVTHQGVGSPERRNGDMQGIAGKTLQEIEGLEMKALEEGSSK